MQLLSATTLTLTLMKTKLDPLNGSPRERVKASVVLSSGGSFCGLPTQGLRKLDTSVLLGE